MRTSADWSAWIDLQRWERYMLIARLMASDRKNTTWAAPVPRRTRPACRASACARDSALRTSRDIADCTLGCIYCSTNATDHRTSWRGARREAGRDDRARRSLLKHVLVSGEAREAPSIGAGNQGSSACSYARDSRHSEKCLAWPTAAKRSPCAAMCTVCRLGSCSVGSRVVVAPSLDRERALPSPCG